MHAASVHKLLQRKTVCEDQRKISTVFKRLELNRPLDQLRYFQDFSCALQLYSPLLRSTKSANSAESISNSGSNASARTSEMSQSCSTISISPPICSQSITPARNRYRAYLEPLASLVLPVSTCRCRLEREDQQMLEPIQLSCGSSWRQLH